MSNYTADTIEILDDLDHIRRRPEMYIGDVGVDGLHHLLKEVVDNAIDEYQDGHVRHIVVRLDTERGIAEVRDDGRGIPVDTHEKAGVSTLQAVFTKLHAGGKFGKGAYTSSVVGLHGIGVKAVNALSTQLDVWVRPESTSGRTYHQAFHAGVPKGPVKASQHSLSCGTLVRFQPDQSIFGNAAFQKPRIAAWLREVSCLCPGLALQLKADNDEPERFYAEDGLLALLEEVRGAADPLHEPLVFEDPLFRAALVWTNDPELRGEHWRSYVNVSPTPEHGTHVAGLRKAIGDVLLEGAKVRHRGEDLRDGLVGIIHALVPEPKFRGQTKIRLENPELVDQIAERATVTLRQFAARQPKVVKMVLDRAQQLRDARKSFRAKQKAIKGVRVGRDAVIILPGKLIEAPDCSPEVRELYIVEGDSALGSVRDARLRRELRKRMVHYQEIFPLKGKPINAVQRPSLAKTLESEEIKQLVLAIGAGIGDSFDIDRMRCRAVYLLTDADPDGQHIQALLLGFFARFMPDLIAEDRLRVILSPLYRGVSKDKRVFGDTIEEVHKQLGKSKHYIERLKGLGESNADELQVYAMDPKTRKVLRVTWEGEQDEKLVLTYMGSDAFLRKEILGVSE